MSAPEDDVQSRSTLNEDVGEGVVIDKGGAIGISDEKSFQLNNTTLPSPFSVPLLGLSAVASVRVTASENVLNIITVTVTSATPDLISSIELQYKLSTDNDYISAGNGVLGDYDIIDLLDSTYDVRVRGVNTFGVKGSYTTITGISTTSIGTPPNDVIAFTAQINGPVVQLTWDASTEPSLSYYRIRHALEETGATWSDSVTLVDKVARPATSISAPALPGTYMIRSYDKQDTPSSSFSSIVVPETFLEDFGIDDTDIEDPSFAGTKTDC